MKRPASQYYWGDWRRDTALQSCSLTARGLWHEMNCLMHDCEPYGHLMVGPTPMQPAQLARLVGVTAKECADLLAELEAASVFSRTEQGVIFSRRMVRDEDLRNRRAAGGAAGAEHGFKGAEGGRKGGRPKRAEGGFETPLPSDKEPPPASASASASATALHPREQGAHSTAASARSPTTAGAICRAMKAIGIADVNPGNPDLLALIEVGATEEEFRGAAQAAVLRGKGFAYALGAVKGQRAEAAKTLANAHRGAMPRPSDARTAANIAVAQRVFDRTRTTE